MVVYHTRVLFKMFGVSPRIIYIHESLVIDFKNRIHIHVSLGGGFKYFLCSPLPGEISEMIQFDDHIF